MERIYAVDSTLDDWMDENIVGTWEWSSRYKIIENQEHQGWIYARPVGQFYFSDPDDAFRFKLVWG